MDKEKEQEAKKRFEEMKRQAQQEGETKKTVISEADEIPREAFRKNMGCGG